jgi:hypothetical protein
MPHDSSTQIPTFGILTSSSRPGYIRDSFEMTGFTQTDDDYSIMKVDFVCVILLTLSYGRSVLSCLIAVCLKR